MEIRRKGGKGGGEPIPNGMWEFFSEYKPLQRHLICTIFDHYLSWYPSEYHLRTKFDHSHCQNIISQSQNRCICICSIWESFWFGQILLCTSSQARQLLENWDLLNCICRKMAKLFIELKLKSICQKENMCISKVFMKRGFDEVEKYICNQLSKCQSFWNCCHQNIYLAVKCL